MAVEITNRAPGPQYWLIGDSLGVGLLPPLKKLAAAAGVTLLGSPVGGTSVGTWTNNAQYVANVQAALAWPATTFLVSLGTNDSASLKAPDIKPLVTRLQSKGAKVIWIGQPTTGIKNADSIIASIQKQCKALGVAYIDSRKTSFEHAPGDKIHASPRGYATWASWLWPQIKSESSGPLASIGWGLAAIGAVALAAWAGFKIFDAGSRIRNPWGGDGDEAYREKYDNAVNEVIWKLEQSKPGDRYPWKKLPLTRATKIWKSFSRLGHVPDRDVKALDDIAEEMVDKIVLLEVFTDLAGHSDVSVDNVLEIAGIDSTEPGLEATFEKLGDYILDERGQWRISDYAVGPLHSLAVKVLEAETPEEKIVLVDRMFNITHQRSDLAGWFIEDNKNTLQQLSNGDDNE